MVVERMLVTYGTLTCPGLMVVWLRAETTALVTDTMREGPVC